MTMKANVEKYALRIRSGENIVMAIKNCEKLFFK